MLLAYMFTLFFLHATESMLPQTDESEEILSRQQAEKISMLSVLTELPETSWEGLKMGFSKESLPYWGLILGSTAILYHYDEDIYRDIQHSGRKWGIGNGDNTHAAFEIGPWPVRFPTDTGSTLYFLGDGITHFTIAGSLIGYGYFSENNRPYNTGLQLVHGMAVSTFFSQLLKRSFGRESPYVKTKDFGAWRPFPSISEYGNNTPSYDAMPSGHIMTATLTFTILIENYPEHEYWLRPLEITWLTLLGYQMVNNGVHWASDYPLGIAMGYVFGKAAAQLGRREKEKTKPNETSWIIVPTLQNGLLTTQLIVNF
jgi:hypothetical protein